MPGSLVTRPVRPAGASRKGNINQSTPARPPPGGRAGCRNFGRLGGAGKFFPRARTRYGRMSLRENCASSRLAASGMRFCTGKNKSGGGLVDLPRPWRCPIAGRLSTASLIGTSETSGSVGLGDEIALTSHPAGFDGRVPGGPARPPVGSRHPAGLQPAHSLTELLTNLPGQACDRAHGTSQEAACHLMRLTSIFFSLSLGLPAPASCRRSGRTLVTKS